MGHDHGLRGICDEVPGHQRILHPHMAHGDAVAHGDGRKHHRRAACGPDTGLYSLGDLVQPHVAGDDLVIGTDHADEGPGKLLIGIAQRVKQAAVGRPLHAGLDLFRTHTLLLPSVQLEAVSRSLSPPQIMLRRSSSPTCSMGCLASWSRLELKKVRPRLLFSAIQRPAKVPS